MKSILSILVFAFLLFIPLSSAINPVNQAVGTIFVMPSSIESNGKMVFNITSFCVENLYNLTFVVTLYGGGPFGFKLNQIKNATTELHVSSIKPGESILVETDGKLFNTLPILNRMLCPFFTGKLTMKFNSHSETCLIHKLFTIARISEPFYFPYP